MTESEWLEAVALWADVWPERSLPNSSIATWYALLADLDGAAVLTALAAWARDATRPWPPASPGELRGAVDPPDDDWTAALTRLADAVRRYGRYATRPALEPALDGYVDSMGGWTRLCDSLNVADPTQRAQFRDYYTAAARREHRHRAAVAAGGVLPALDERTG